MKPAPLVTSDVNMVQSWMSAAEAVTVRVLTRDERKVRSAGWEKRWQRGISPIRAGCARLMAAERETERGVRMFVR